MANAAHRTRSRARHRRLPSRIPDPEVTTEIVAKLGGIHIIHLLQAAIADEFSALFENNGEKPVSNFILVVKISLQPALHLFTSEWRMVECSHHIGIGEDPKQRVEV